MSPTYAACCCFVDEDCLDPCDCDLREQDEEIALQFNFSGRETITSTAGGETLLCPGTPGGSANECVYSEENTIEELFNGFIIATLDLRNINAKTCESIPTIIEEFGGSVSRTTRYQLVENGGACRFGQDCYDYFQTCTETVETSRSHNLTYSSPYVNASLERYSDCSQDFPTSTRCACVESPIDINQCFLRVRGGFVITPQQVEEYGVPAIRREVRTEGCATYGADDPADECETFIDSQIANNFNYNFFINSYGAAQFDILYAVERDPDGKCAFVKFAERVGKQRVVATNYAGDLCPLSVSASVDLDDPNNTTRTYCGNTQQTEITGVNTPGDCGMLNYATFEAEGVIYFLPCNPFNQNDVSIKRTASFLQELRQSGYASIG